jgi:hypothetical protein
MTPERIIAATVPISRLNSWARLPMEHQLGMYGAKSAIYAMKLTVIKQALAAGLATWRIVAVERPCKTCGGTGEFRRWDRDDEDYREGEDCRRCNATGNVVLKFAETKIGNARWHTPRPRAGGLIPANRWDDVAEATDWTPEQPGKVLDRTELIWLLNEAESLVIGDKLIPYANQIWYRNPYLYSLHLGEFHTCFHCGKTAKPNPWEIHRPSLLWKQALCDICRASAWRFPRQWPANMAREGRGRWNSEYPEWADRAPLPPLADLACVRQWMARRGIIEGFQVPGEYCVLAGLDLGVFVLAIKDGSAFVRAGYGDEVPVLRVDAEKLRGWHLKRIAA